jgi:hypothetical protein
VRRNKGAGRWRRSYKQRLQAEQAEIHARRRVISADTQLLVVAGLWFEVVVEKLPEAIVTHAIVKGRHIRKVRAEPRYDVVLRKLVSRERDDEERVFVYGAADLFATNKRQLSRRELKDHGLSSSQVKERQ